jgi:histone H3/H4
MTLLSRYKVRLLMRRSGAKRISREAIDLMCLLLEDYCKELTAKGLLLMENSRRTTLLKRDLELCLVEGVQVPGGQKFELEGQGVEEVRILLRRNKGE